MEVEAVLVERDVARRSLTLWACHVMPNGNCFLELLTAKGALFL